MKVLRAQERLGIQIGRLEPRLEPGSKRTKGTKGTKEPTSKNQNGPEIKGTKLKGIETQGFQLSSLVFFFVLVPEFLLFFVLSPLWRTSLGDLNIEGTHHARVLISKVFGKALQSV